MRVTALQQERNMRLRGRVDKLLSENEELHKNASDWKVRAKVEVSDALARDERLLANDSSIVEYQNIRNLLTRVLIFVS